MFQNTYNDMISIDDLCEMLTIGKNTAYHLLKTNQIKAFKIGRIWKIPRNSVSDYVVSQTKNNIPFSK
ncbi:MAG: helix-turn-helix domain-containing protein [Lachnospiraceae bacterium]|nr:helix-turn-helix domain-containing protein [Lachnospiraceae bacterium]